MSCRLALGADFGRAAADATMDLTGDDDQELRKARSLMMWDRKKKKFVGQVIIIAVKYFSKSEYLISYINLI